jgi:hypothetical protein
MRFQISCETFARLSNACKIDANEPRFFLRSVRIENINGHAFAIASNAKIMAVEYLDQTTEPNGFVQVIASDALINQCKIEAAFDSILQIDLIDNEVVKYVNIATTFGYKHPENGGFFWSSENAKGWNDLSKWREIPNTFPTETSDGFMFMDAELLADLGRSAPSGRITFPEKINTKQPVIVCDSIDPAWMGMFVSIASDNNVTMKPAKIADWWPK